MERMGGWDIKGGRWKEIKGKGERDKKKKKTKVRTFLQRS